MDIEFLQWVSRKFYMGDGSLLTFFRRTKRSTPTFYLWKSQGVPKPFLFEVQQELTILKIMGRVNHDQSVHLDDLWEEYKKEKPLTKNQESNDKKGISNKEK